MNASLEEKWAIVARTIRERGEDGFFNDKCWGLATDDKQKATGEDALTALELWLVKAYHALKHIGELPVLPNRKQPDAGVEEGGGGEEGSGEDGDGGEEGSGEEGDGGEEEVDPAAKLLFTLLGNGSDYQDLTPALALQAHCLIRTPEEQMRQDDASKLESRLSGKPLNHEHCEYGLGQKMSLVEQLGKLLLRGGYRHVRQVFDLDGNGIVANANAALVDAANRQILKQMTDEDKQLLRRLQQIAEQLKAVGKQGTIIEVLGGLGKAMGLALKDREATTARRHSNEPRERRPWASL